MSPPAAIVWSRCKELQNEQQEKKNLRTGIVLGTIAALFFLGFLVRRLFF